MSILLKPFWIKVISKQINQSNIRILDIGSGSHSASLTKKWIPNCHYTGIDKDKNYNNTELDLSRMDEFIQLDLTKLQFDQIPDNSYDLIIMSHVIEHLHNGDEVLEGLMPKLKTAGIFYIEFPSEKSISFPSKRETLNFFDDLTHCRIYSLKEVCNILMKFDFRVIKAGKRRNLFNIAIMPLKIVVQLLTKGYVKGGVYWDFYGFADYVVATKTAK